LVTGSTDDEKVRIFDMPSGAPSLVIPNVSSIDTLAFTPDGKYLAVHRDKTAEVFAFPHGAPLARFDQAVIFWSTAISPDGRYLATGNGDRTMRVHDIAKRAELRRANDFGGLWDVSFSSDGRYIATGSSEKSAAVFDASTARELARWDCGGEVTRVAFSPDDNMCYALEYNPPKTPLRPCAVFSGERKTCSRLPVRAWDETSTTGNGSAISGTGHIGEPVLTSQTPTSPNKPSRNDDN
jgi:WD40 repeat protein